MEERKIITAIINHGLKVEMAHFMHLSAESNESHKSGGWTNSTARKLAERHFQ